MRWDSNNFKFYSKRDIMLKSHHQPQPPIKQINNYRPVNASSNLENKGIIKFKQPQSQLGSTGPLQLHQPVPLSKQQPMIDAAPQADLGVTKDQIHHHPAATYSKTPGHVAAGSKVRKSSGGQHRAAHVGNSYYHLDQNSLAVMKQHLGGTGNINILPTFNKERFVGGGGTVSRKGNTLKSSIGYESNPNDYSNQKRKRKVGGTQQQDMKGINQVHNQFPQNAQTDNNLNNSRDNLRPRRIIGKSNTSTGLIRAAQRHSGLRQESQNDMRDSSASEIHNQTEETIGEIDPKIFENIDSDYNYYGKAIMPQGIKRMNGQQSDSNNLGLYGDLTQDDIDEGNSAIKDHQKYTNFEDYRDSSMQQLLEQNFKQDIVDGGSAQEDYGSILEGQQQLLAIVN